MKKQDSLDFIEELYSTIRSRARSKKKIPIQIYY